MKLLLPDLRESLAQPEAMDSPLAEERRLLKTVRQFALLNRLFSRSRELLRRHVMADMLRSPGRVFEVLDLGSGGCDLALWFCRHCRRLGLQVRMTCLDHDPRLVAFARERCRAFPEIKVRQASAYELGSWPASDYIFSNHLLHHLERERIPGLLDLVAERTRRLFILNDLRRSRRAYVGYTFFSALFLHGSYAFHDGRLSIRRGFLRPELQALVGRCRFAGRMRVLALAPARLLILGTGAHAGRVSEPMRSAKP